MTNEQLAQLRAGMANGMQAQENVDRQALSDTLSKSFKRFEEDLRGTPGRQGVIGRMAESFSKSDTPASRRNLWNGLVKDQLRAARAFKDQIQLRMYDSKLSAAERLRIFQAYMDSVFMPVRELAVLTWDDENPPQKEPLYDLLLSLPVEVIKDSASRRAAEQGLDKDNPYGIKIADYPTDIPACRGRARAIFDSNPLQTLLRDIKAVKYSVDQTGAVNRDSYIKSVKKMAAHMLIAQISTFENFINADEPAADANGHKAELATELELSLKGCQSSLGGGLPETLKIPLASPKDRSTLLDQFLLNNGLVYDVGSGPVFREQLITQKNGAVKIGNLSGYMPFSELRAAERVLNPKLRHSNPYKWEQMEPAIDDTKDFDKAMAGIQQRVVSAMPQVPSEAARVAQLITNITPEDLPMPSAGKDVVAKTKGLSAYLAQRMDRMKVTDWRMAVPTVVKGELYNNVITHQMPPLDAPDESVRWALGQMSKFAFENKNTTDPALLKIVKAHCPALIGPDGKPRFCAEGGGGPKEWLAFLADDKLAVYRRNTPYLPRLDTDDKTLREVYPDLQELWRDLAPLKNQFINAQQREWDYIVQSIDTNPWASMRVAYRIAELDAERLAPVRTKSADDFQPGARPYLTMGRVLHLDRPLSMFQSNEVMTRDERTHLWDEKSRTLELKESSNIMTQVVPRTGRPLWRDLSAVHGASPLLSRTRAMQAADRYLSAEDAAEVKSRMSELWSDTSSNLVPKRLGAATQPTTTPSTSPSTRPATQSTTQPATQPSTQAIGEAEMIPNNYLGVENLARIFEAKPQSTEASDAAVAQMLLTKNTDPTLIREQFLSVDGEQKRLLYRKLVREAATARKEQAKKFLGELCQLKPDDTAGFRRIVRATASAQDELNRSLGLPGLPPGVMEKMDEWLDTAKQNMLFGGLQMASLAMLSMLATTCVAGTLMACAPLSASVLALTSLVTGGAMVYNDVSAMRESNRIIAFANQARAINMTTREQVDEAHDSDTGFWGYAAIGLDGVGTLAPVMMGAHSMLLSKRAIQQAWRGTSMAERGLMSKTGSMIKLALQDAGAAVKITPGKSYTDIMASALHEQELLLSGSHLDTAIRGKAMLTADRGALVSDARSSYGRTLAREFNNDPATLRRYLESRVQSRLADLEAELARKKLAASDPAAMSIIQFALRKLGVQQRSIDKLAKQIATGKTINSMLAELRKVETSNGTLSSWIESNAMELSELFNNMPSSWWDMPFSMLLEGSPYLGRRLPYVTDRLPTAGLSDSFVVRRASAAFDNIYYHAYRDEALRVLGHGGKYEPLHDTFEATNRFLGLAQMIDDPAARKEMLQVKNDITRAAYDYQAATSTQKLPSFEEFTRIVWQPADPKESMLGTGWFNTTPADRLFSDFKTFKSPARTVEYLGKQWNEKRDLDSFEDYLVAYKLLLFAKGGSPTH